MTDAGVRPVSRARSAGVTGPDPRDHLEGLALGQRQARRVADGGVEHDGRGAQLAAGQQHVLHQVRPGP